MPNGNSQTDLRELPAYSFLEASRYLRIPTATLRDWIYGWTYATAAEGERFAPPLLALPESALASLSFFNLVEAHVLDAIRRIHRIPMQKVRRALDYLQKNLPSRHPLADERFETDGIELFVERFGSLILASQSGQVTHRELVAGHLRRIEHDAEGQAARLFPVSRRRGDSGIRHIVIDPDVAFGRAALAGSNIATCVIAERHKAGETISALAQDYACTREQIEAAIHCELGRNS
jgi:uncharacterized protein (DUF433 family)